MPLSLFSHHHSIQLFLVSYVFFLLGSLCLHLLFISFFPSCEEYYVCLHSLKCLPYLFLAMLGFFLSFRTMSSLQKRLLSMIRCFRREWRLYSDSERITICGADCMLMVLQLAVAEVNKKVGILRRGLCFEYCEYYS